MTEQTTESIKRIKKYAENNSISLIKSKKNHFIMKEGSTFVYIMINSDTDDEWVAFYSLVVKDAKKKKKLLKKLLEMNSYIPFGAFGLQGNYIVFKHCILGGHHMDEKEFLQSLLSVSKIADEYDNIIIDTYGGKTAMDILIEDLFDNPPEK